jgi:hypothetical protein
MLRVVESLHCGCTARERVDKGRRRAGRQGWSPSSSSFVLAYARRRRRRSLCIRSRLLGRLDQLSVAQWHRVLLLLLLLLLLLDNMRDALLAVAWSSKVCRATGRDGRIPWRCVLLERDQKAAR